MTDVLTMVNLLEFQSCRKLGVLLLAILQPTLRRIKAENFFKEN